MSQKQSSDIIQKSALIHMKTALDMAHSSPHPTNKIAATLFGKSRSGLEFSVIRTNHWPKDIDKKIGRERKIGNSSGTIHAETACILASPHATEGNSICITDPFCPNCAKNIAEAGIKNIYIDSQGFKKDFFTRRSGHFDTMSMQICERAGINVFAVNLNTDEIESILEIPQNYEPIEDSPIQYMPYKNMDEKTFIGIIEKAFETYKKRKFSTAFVKDTRSKERFILTARAHAVTGYSMKNPDEALDLLTPIGKYSFIQEPINRLLMHLARKNLKLIDDYLFCSQVPTSREQVNLVGAGIKRITIGDSQRCRDSHGFTALKQLSDAEIINYT